MWTISYLKHGFDIFNKKHTAIKFDYDNHTLKKQKKQILQENMKKQKQFSITCTQELKDLLSQDVSDIKFRE